MTFSSAGSSDPEGQALAYKWDFGDGSARRTTPGPGARLHGGEHVHGDPDGAGSAGHLGDSEDRGRGRQEHPAGRDDRRTDGGLPVRRWGTGQAGRLRYRRPGRSADRYRLVMAGHAAARHPPAPDHHRHWRHGQLHAGDRPRRGFELRDPADCDRRSRRDHLGDSDDPAAHRAADAGVFSRRGSAVLRGRRGARALHPDLGGRLPRDGRGAEDPCCRRGDLRIRLVE